MEIPIQVSVRVFPVEDNGEESIVQPIPVLSTNVNDVQLFSGMVQIGKCGPQFPVTHALPLNCDQSDLFNRLCFPLLPMFLEGFDSSVIVYGQSKTGKSYTLFGRLLEMEDNKENEEGIVQKSIRQIFSALTTHLYNRNFVMNIGWVEISEGNQITDLLNSSGIVQCQNLNEAFHWLKVGSENRSKDNSKTHHMFTLTLEQQWLSPDGLLQHRLSTISFCDLASTERTEVMNNLTNREILIPNNIELQALENIVNLMTLEPMHRPADIEAIPFNQTTLTTLLRDSFGGRAQTLFIVCCSPLEENLQETILNLQFAVKVQCIRNLVTMNAFSDNNTAVGFGPYSIPDIVPNDNPFDSRQKLLSNAENLFCSLMKRNNNLTNEERIQISEWLDMKTDCESLHSSTELNVNLRSHLGPIQEEPVDDPNLSESFSITHHNSDSDSESQNLADLDEKLDNLMMELQIKTDDLIKYRYTDYLNSHPKAIFDSMENKNFALVLNADGNMPAPSNHIRERRRSVQPGTLSSIEIEMLNRVAFRDNDKNRELVLAHPSADSPKEILSKKLRKATTDLEVTQRQIKELEQTISLKQKLISDLIKNSDTKATAKNRFNKKKHKLECEYEKTKKLLSKAVVGGRDKTEIDKLKSLTNHLEKRLQDLVSIKHIATESVQKVKKLQQSVQEWKKQLEVLQKAAKKERKVKESLEQELIEAKDKVKEGDFNTNSGTKAKNLKLVNARLSHLDHVLREKSENLEKYKDEDKRESLRHEIRNLRCTKDHLLEQRFTLDRKLKREMLTCTEERKLLECDEAIEAIDAAIEMKNEQICGRKSIDMSESLEREKGEQMLMARLNKLSEDEMRTLLYKYFQKVIDLRESSRKLESQLGGLEQERDAWEWRERNLNNAVRQARLEGERNAVLLQRQHETKLTLMLRHLADETNSSTGTSTDNQIIPSGNRQLDLLKRGDKRLDLYPMENQISKYKPLDGLKEKSHKSGGGTSTNNKLFAKFQVLTRYTNEREKRKMQQGSEMIFGDSDANNNPGHLSIIPMHNLRQLQPSSTPPLTKVTRAKNKLIIEQQETPQHQQFHPHIYYRK